MWKNSAVRKTWSNFIITTLSLTVRIKILMLHNWSINRRRWRWRRRIAEHDRVQTCPLCGDGLPANQQFGRTVDVSDRHISTRLELVSSCWGYNGKTVRTSYWFYNLRWNDGAWQLRKWITCSCQRSIWGWWESWCLGSWLYSVCSAGFHAFRPLRIWMRWYRAGLQNSFFLDL